MADIVRASGAGDKPTTCPFDPSGPSRGPDPWIGAADGEVGLVSSRGSRLSSWWKGDADWVRLIPTPVITPPAIAIGWSSVVFLALRGRRWTARSVRVFDVLAAFEPSAGRRQKRHRVELGAYRSKSVTAAARSVTRAPEGQTGMIRPARRFRAALCAGAGFRSLWSAVDGEWSVSSKRV